MKRLLFLIFSTSVLFSFKSSENVEIKWDFSKYKKITYSFSEISISKINSFGNKEHLIFESNGIIELSVESDSLASVNYKILKNNIYVIDSLGNKLKKNNGDYYIYEELTAKGIKEDDISGIYESTSILEHKIKAIFPVSKDIVQINKKNPYNYKLRIKNFDKYIKTIGNSYLKNLNKSGEIYDLEMEAHLENETNERQKDLLLKIDCNSKVKYNSSKFYFTEGTLNYKMILDRFVKENEEPDFDFNEQFEYRLISVE